MPYRSKAATVDQWTVTRPNVVTDLARLTGWTGVLAGAARAQADGWLPPQLKVANSSSGDVLAAREGQYGMPVTTTSGGAAWLDEEHAQFIAICEGIERYCTFVYSSESFTFGSVQQIGARAEVFPREELASFSAKEIARSNGTLVRLNSDSGIRWIDAIDLMSGADVLVPAVMTYLVSDRMLDERFWMPFTTGVAVHRSYDEAVVGAMCELVERDASSITWLQKMNLPRLHPECLNEPTLEMIEWFQRRGTRTYLFDATTDVGLPTVWCTQTNPNTKRAAQTTATAASMSQSEAAFKAVTEACRFNGSLSQLQPKASYEDLHGITDSAVYMARPGRSSAFRFLLDDYDERPFGPLRHLGLDTPESQLGWLLERFRSCGVSAYAVDLTMSEAEKAGLVAVRVVAPQLQPLSMEPYAQYRGNPRLYDVPSRLGHRVHREASLNSFPVPVT